MSLYKLKNVTRTFGKRTVLSIDSLEIEQGRIYALHGPNGAGKTTLINILGFLDSPTTGSILFEGEWVDFRNRQLRQFRQNVVVVSQRPVLFTTSVYKNMEFGLKVRGISARKRRTIIEASLDLVGVKHLINAPAIQLSGGETQRVVLARALALSPRTIICDEPTASVDLENQVAVMELLKKINREKGITIILSSHDRLQSTQLAHQSLFLDHGRLFDGAYENLFEIRDIQNNGEEIFYILDGGVRLKLAQEIRQRNRVLLDPWKLKLAEHTGDNQLNALTGRIVQIIKEKEGIRLVLNSSIQLVVMLSETNYRERCPMVGEQITVHITDDAVRII